MLEEIIIKRLDSDNKVIRNLLRAAGDQRHYHIQNKQIDKIRLEESTKRSSLLDRSEEEDVIYERLVQMLGDKIEPELDDMNITLLAHALATVNICNEVLRAEGLVFTSGNSYQQQRPEVAIKKQAIVEILKLSEKLGLSPKDRKNLDSVKKDDEELDAAGGEL